jgi:adenylate cyclase
MADPLARDALRLIQDIVIEAKGSPLDREALRRVEQVLRRAMEPGAAPEGDTGYSRREATILFADLRGFSAMAAAYAPEVVLGVLSRYFGCLSEIAVDHYGTIDKFIGDAIMVVFHGESSVPHDHARRAILCAVEMQMAMKELREKDCAVGLPEIFVGIGVSTGTVMAGLIGSRVYRAFTVIGEDVNLAARIEAFALRGQVLMSDTTYEHCRGFVEAGEPMEVYVKGRSRQLRIREALAIPELGKAVPRQEVRKSPRVEVDLPLHYQALSGKAVEPRARTGRLQDLGYHGALAELEGPLPAYSEIKLAFDLPGLNHRAQEIYARVVSMRTRGERHVAGLEFTAVPAETAERIRLFVQMCIQDKT